MKKFIFSIIGIIVFTLFTGGVVFAQGMPALSKVEGVSNTATGSDGHTAREEAEGKIVWEKLQTKQTTCSDLSDENFGTLGEYFMGQMLGTSHEAMNNMMIQMMGEKGEEQMHVVMGKRLSGCDTSAAFPSQGVGSLPMMNMMGNFTTNPTSWFGWGFGWIFMILFWGLIVLGIIALVKWIMNQSKDEAKSKSALDILKERYVKGEIDEKEFKDKKKDLDGR